MNVQDTRKLSPEAQDALRERVVQALLTQRMTVSATARTFGVHRATVSAWWNRFQRRGPEALASQKRGAKPKPLLTADQETRLLSVLATGCPTNSVLARRCGRAKPWPNRRPENWG